MLTTVLKSKTQALYQSQYVRQASVLLMGQAATQLLVLVSYPLLARLYSPAQFGEFAFFNSLLTILLLAASGRYDTAIILSQNSRQAQRLFQLSQCFLLGYSAFLCLVLLFPPIQDLLLAQELNPSYFWLLPLLVLLGGYWQIVQNWLTRFQLYTHLSSTLFIQRLIILLTSLACFYLSLEVNGLIIGLLAGAFVVFALSFYYQRQPLLLPLKTLLGFAKSFRDFPLYAIPTLFTTISTLHLPVIWFTFFYSQQEAGSYSIAFSLIMLPVTALRTSFGHLFYQRVAQTKEAERYQLLSTYCQRFAYVLIPLTLFLTFFGETLVQVFLGDSWQATGMIISLLSPTMLAQGLVLLLKIYLNTNRQQKQSFLLNIFKFMMWVLALGIAWIVDDFYLSFKLMTLFSYVQLFFIFLTARKYHNKLSRGH